jgi:flagellar protein FlbD
LKSSGPLTALFVSYDFQGLLRAPPAPEPTTRPGQLAMIRLTHLDGEPFILNAELIRYVESRPDTFITLTSGERLVVRETMDEVLERTMTYQQSKYLIPVPVAGTAGSPSASCKTQSGVREA